MGGTGLIPRGWGAGGRGGVATSNPSERGQLLLHAGWALLCENSRANVSRTCVFLRDAGILYFM